MTIRVLLADDNEMMRRAISRLLNGDPEIYLLAETTSFADVVRVASKLRPHIVVLDLHLPDDADVTPLHVKSNLDGIKLLAISIWDDDETKNLAQAYGAVALLDKSKLSTELIPAIKLCADGHKSAGSNAEPGGPAN
jgi:DNA-binding NarL/FixJ family response regulator